MHLYHTNIPSFVIRSTLSLSGAATIEGKLELPEGLKNKNYPPLQSTLITLNDGEFLTYSTQNNTFSFHDVPTGVHVLDVHCHTYHYSQVKIQILEGEEPKCIEYFYPGAKKSPISHPLTLYTNAKLNYFQPRPTFSPFRMLKNPMVLIMLFSVGMMFVMPQMMGNLDPEQKEQMKKQMEMQQDPSKMLSQLWGEISGAGAPREISEKKVVRRERLKRE